MRVTPEAVDGVSYEPAEAFDVELGATATVTATLDPEGVAWAAPEDMPGWVIGSPTEATFTVTSVMSADPCLRVAPLAPVVTASTCADGVVTASVLRPQGPPEVVYSFDPEGTVGEGGARGAWSFDPSVTSVTVTATLRSPNINGWSALSDGWQPVEGDATKATLTVTLVGGDV